MKPLILLVFLLLAPVAALCQNAKIDSLKRVIETTKVDTVKGRSLCRLCGRLMNAGHYEEGLDMGKQGLEICRKTKDRPGEGSCLNVIGTIYSNQGDYPQALEYYKRSLKIQEDMGNQAGIAYSMGNIAFIYESQGDYAKALTYNLRNLKVCEEIGDRPCVAISLNNIGVIYLNQGDYARALKYFHSSVKKQEEIGDLLGVANSLNNIGAIYLNQGDYARAHQYFQRSLEIDTQMGNQAGIAASLVNIGALYDDQNDSGRALEYQMNALKILEKINNQADMVKVLANIALLYLKLGNVESARSYAQRGFRQAQLVGNLEHKQSSAQALYQADSALGNWKAAFEAARLYHIYSDSMKNDEQSQELGRLESKAEYEKQAEIDRLKNEVEKNNARERYNWMLGSAGGGLLLLMIIAFTLFRGRQKEKKANAALRALNEQISQQKAEIEAQNSEITSQRDQLNETNQRLIALDRMKEELSGMIVHDLKNPLNAVLTMASLPPEPKRLQTIRGAGQQMSQLILNLLDVQKYEASALVLNPETIPAAQLLHRAAEQTEFLAEQKQIRFQIDADPRLAAEADAELIVRVLVNLLTNAIKYAPAGDVIEIQAVYDPERGAVFRVTDHGKGIPPDQLDRIFDKFSQVDGGQASGKLRSTGLGLTFCRLTVEAHGGRIDVRSEVGRFTIFEFNLPNACVAEQEFVARSSKEAPVIGPLSAELQAQHAQLLSMMRNVPIYSVSDLLDLLERLPDQPPELAAWKAALETAALSANEARFRELLA